jgi:hypothetical protein
MGCRIGTALAAAALVVTLSDARSAPIEFIFTGAGTASFDGGPTRPAVIQLQGIGDTTNRTSTSPTVGGVIWDSYPLSSLLVIAYGVAGGYVATPGTFESQNVDQFRFPFMPDTVSMGGIVLDTTRPIATPPGLPPAYRCLDCTTRLLLRDYPAVSFTFDPAASVETPGVYFISRAVGATTPAIPQIVLTAPIPEPSTYALVATALALVGWRTKRRRAYPGGRPLECPEAKQER